LFERVGTRLVQGIGQFFGEKIGAALQMFAVSRTQSIVLFPYSKVLVYLGIRAGCTLVHHRLVFVGPGLPLITDVAFPGLHVVQELSRPGGADWGPDCAFEAALVEHQGDAFALEKYFCKPGAVLAGKAPAADGLNLANSMVGMMNTIALGYGNVRSPFRGAAVKS
jgi:hypothetical protein